MALCGGVVERACAAPALYACNITDQVVAQGRTCRVRTLALSAWACVHFIGAGGW